VDVAQDEGADALPPRGGGLTVAVSPPPHAYRGWSAAEIAADQALAASIRALGQADGLLNPALDAIFARRPLSGVVQGGRPAQPQQDYAMGRDVAR
jgi:hypothetical protein